VWFVWVAEFVEGVGEPRRPFSSSFSSSWTTLSGRARGSGRSRAGAGRGGGREERAKSAHDARLGVIVGSGRRKGHWGM